MVSAAKDTSVDVEAEEKETQHRDMVDVTDNNLLSPHVDGSDTLASNGNLAVIGKGDELIVDAMI